MADKKKKNTEEVIDSKKLAALEARIEGLNEELEETVKKTEEAASWQNSTRSAAARQRRN